MILASVLLPVCQSPAVAQFFVTSRFELSDSVTLDLADSSARTHFERVKACLADEQWDEAVETLRQVMENHGRKVVELSDGRYINVRDYCHLRIAALPPPALALYRDRVDVQARRLYEKSLTARDADRLRDVAEQWFASSVADEALYALGELSLEQGDYPAARNYWEKLIETPPARIDGQMFDQARRAEGLAEEDARLLDLWYRPAETGESTIYELYARQPMADEDVRRLVEFWNSRGLIPQRLAYPRTDLDLAEVRARLVLVSILEGSIERAEGELAAYANLHAGAEGTIGGRSGAYVELLSQLLDSSGDWHSVELADTWNTFAGNMRRAFVAPGTLELGKLKWQQSLERTSLADARMSSGYASPRRVAEDQDGLLSYHPIVVNDVVFIAHTNQIHAFDLNTGKPAWGQNKGIIYRDDDMGIVRPHARQTSLGAPRFTLTAHGDRLFARVGSHVTSSSTDNPFPSSTGKLICLDLSKQGILLWEKRLDDEKWAFEGPPVCDGQQIYVALRRSDIRPQAHVACFDVETGQERWRRFVCSAETPGRGQMDEITHNLLTLHRDTLYFNTNLGAVAALDTKSGDFRWISTYPRASDGDLNRQAAHFYRDLNPCVYDRGRLFVAPSDSAAITALNAQTGELLWRSASGYAQDVVHLLGVCGNNVVASGDRLWWFHADTGKIVGFWPDGPSPKGFGRGLIAGNEVVWPTREELIRFDQFSRQRVGIVRLIDRNASGGNLVAAGDTLLIASGDTLYAFENHGAETGGEDGSSVVNDE